MSQVFFSSLKNMSFTILAVIFLFSVIRLLILWRTYFYAGSGLLQLGVVLVSFVISLIRFTDKPEVKLQNQGRCTLIQIKTERMPCRCNFSIIFCCFRDMREQHTDMHTKNILCIFNFWNVKKHVFGHTLSFGRFIV